MYDESQVSDKNKRARGGSDAVEVDDEEEDAEEEDKEEEGGDEERGGRRGPWSSITWIKFMRAAN